MTFSGKAKWLERANLSAISEKNAVQKKSERSSEAVLLINSKHTKISIS